MVGAVVVDPDGVYDPAVINDRLLLGLKGTMSEFELNLLRQRSLEAIRQKARRGEPYAKRHEARRDGSRTRTSRRRVRVYRRLRA